MLKQIKDKNFIPNLLWPLVVIVLALLLLNGLFATDFHLESRHPCKIKRDSDFFVNPIKSLKVSSLKKVIEQDICLDFVSRADLFFSAKLQDNNFAFITFAKKERNPQVLARASPRL